MIGVTWKRTKDAEGHIPLFPIECRFCSIRMFVRHTEICLKNSLHRGVGKPCNQITYKCQKCGNVIWFNVQDDREYLQEVCDRRDGAWLYYPTITKWKEDEEIKRQLEALGYVGGR